jgi:hypothetical protein
MKRFTGRAGKGTEIQRRKVSDPCQRLKVARTRRTTLTWGTVYKGRDIALELNIPTYT